RRVNRAGAWPPDSPAALADLLDDLVAVHRLLGQQCQRCGANVTASRTRPPHATRFPPVRPESLWPASESRTAEAWPEPRSAKRTAKMLPRTAAGSSASGVPLVVTVPAASFAIIGGLPPARTAASAALFFVSHRCCSLQMCATGSVQSVSF